MLIKYNYIKVFVHLYQFCEKNSSITPGIGEKSESNNALQEPQVNASKKEWNIKGPAKEISKVRLCELHYEKTCLRGF